MVSLEDIINFLFYALIPYHNPGGINMSSILVLGGFALWGLSSLLYQLGAGPIDPMVLEIGKAAFYTGLGSAGQKASNDRNNKSSK